MDTFNAFQASIDPETSAQNLGAASIFYRLLTRIIDFFIVYLLVFSLGILLLSFLAISQPEKTKLYQDYLRHNNLPSWESLQQNPASTNLILDCSSSNDQSCFVVREYLYDQILILSASLLVVHIFYFCVLTKSRLFNTIGKRLLSIQVVDQTGKTPSLIQLLTREIFFILWYISMILSIFWLQLTVVESLLTFLILISVVKGSLSKDKITLHDQLACTKVVKI
jgi:uncharacterized RDD family membrane protein YckC